MIPLRKQLHVVWRKLLRSPAFTALVILTLALGIGANTAIFSLVDGVLLRPLPFPNAQELYGLWHSAPGIGIPHFEQSNTTYKVYHDHKRSFVEIGLSSGPFMMNLTDGEEPIRVNTVSATSSFFRVLGIPPAIGRVFTEADDTFGGEQIVLLSHELWRGRFGGDPGILGRSIRLDGTSWEVVGIMPEGFTYPARITQIWIPHRIDPANLGRANFSHEAIGRLKPGVSPEAATAELNQLLTRMPEIYPGEMTAGLMENAQMSAFINPLHEDVVGDLSRVLWILLGSVGFVLLIACANVANLFLVRAEGRQRELALRTALGAGPWDVVYHFLSESLLLSLAGGAVGLGLAYAGIRALVALSPENIPRLEEIGIHGTALLFTLGISLLAGLLFGMIPVLRYRRPNLSGAINEGSLRSSSGRQTHRARNLLAVTQVALALMLLIGSGLMARSFWELRGVHPGFESGSILTLRLSLAEAGYPEADDSAGFYQRLLENLRSLPGVEEVGAITNFPLTDGQSNNGQVFEDFPLQPDEIPPVIRTSFATPGYFEAMGILLHEGRTFEPRDHQDRTGAVIVSAGLAEQFWPGGSALGKRVMPGLPDDDPKWYTIVGVVGDVRDDGLEKPPPDMIYYPMIGLGGEYGDWTIYTMSLAIRTSAPPTSLAEPAQRAVWALDPTLPVANLRTADDILSSSMARTTYTMILLGIAAAVALLLGTIGIYGVISYIVAQRTREIGVRMALGAQRRDVSGMVVGRGLVISLVGVAIGIAGAFALTRLMSTLLFGVSGTDPITFLAVSSLLLIVTSAASYLPARRAANINPVEALRY